MSAVEHGVAPSDWALPASTTTGDGDTSGGDGSWCCCCCCCWTGDVTIQ